MNLRKVVFYGTVDQVEEGVVVFLESAGFDETSSLEMKKVTIFKYIFT